MRRTEFHVTAALHADARKELLTALAGLQTSRIEGIVGTIGLGNEGDLFADGLKYTLLRGFAEETFSARDHIRP